MTRLDALEQVLTAAEAVLSAREDQMLTRIEWEALSDAVRNARGRTIYYVATLVYYVLVEAVNEGEARRLAMPLLRDLYTGVCQKLGRDAPIEIVTVRPRTNEEIKLQRWNDETMGDQWSGRVR